MGSPADRELKLQSGEWFYKQLNRRFKTIAAHQIDYDYDHGSGMDPDSLQVREFIERLVETLLSGGLDDVCVSKLHSHPEYERMFACHHGPLCEALARLSFALQMAIANKPLPEKDSPSAAHSALKQLIQDIITEAMTLPKMQNLESQVRRKASEDSNSSLDDINLKTYEDILATAILNKVIEKYQYSKVDNYSSEIDRNSNLLQANRNSSEGTEGKHINYISSVKFGVGSLDDSNDELLSDDKRWTMMTDPSLSLTIEEQIEEVTTYSNSEDENEKIVSDNEGNLCMPDLKLLQRRVPFPEFGMDIVEGSEHSDPEDFSDVNADTQPTDLVSPIDSWEENWLFQRKRLKSGGVATQMPVPMLVPNPSEDFRALIGDRDAEDTSDLSECSEGALEDLVLADIDSHSINDNDLFSVKEDEINCKELVHFEKDKTADMEDIKNSDSSINNNKGNIIEQLIEIKISNESDAPIVDNNIDIDIAETQNIELLKSSIAVDCMSEFGQKDSEYTEDYAVLPQRQMDSLISLIDDSEELKPIPKPRTIGKLNQELPSTEAQIETVVETETKEKVEDSVCINEFAVPPRPGITQSDDENCTLSSTGTIAEREHKKWENAPPLPNNPYSPENISKRLNKKVHSTGSNEELQETLKQAKGETIKTVPMEKPLQINCAPNELECRRYRRDYYINSKLPMDQKSTQSEFTAELSEMKPVHQRYQHKVISEEEPCLTKIQISMKPKTLESENDLMKSKMVNKDSKRTELKEKNDHNEKVDPELPAPHTVENEIARWQNVINQTEQHWIKSVELAKNDVNGQLPVMIEKVKCKKNDQNGFGKLNGNMEPHNNGIDLPNENGFMKKILKQVNSDPKMDLVNSKNNTYILSENGKSTSQDEIQNEKLKVTKNKFIEKNNQSDLALHSLKCESLSTTSEGSIASSDSEFANFLPSVKELAKHFITVTDSDSSTSSPKCPSPTPKASQTDSGSMKKPVPNSQNMSNAIRYPASRNSLSPGQTVREIYPDSGNAYLQKKVHSLTARSISREFREGLKRNLPVQMDRNLYTQGGSDSSLSTTRSVEPRLDGDSTPGYTSDESGAVSPLLSEDIPRIRTLKSSIAFWEQMQHKNDG